MLRITELEQDDAVLLKVAGRVVRHSVPVLERACRSWLTLYSKVELDLREVLILAPAGVELLRR